MNIEILENGDLKITPSRADIDFIKGNSDLSENTLLNELINPYPYKNGYCYFDAAEAFAFISKGYPFISNRVDYTEQNELIVVGDVWAYLDTEQEDLLLPLLKGEPVEFTLLAYPF